MEQLLTFLKAIPEYTAVLSSLQNGENTDRHRGACRMTETGVGQINRSHMIAGLYRELHRPMVIICQDEMAARRLQEELKDFLSETIPTLPGRELTLYDAAVASRSWEQKRLRQLYALATGSTHALIVSWEALSLRTMPKDILLSTAFSLEVGKEYPLDALIQKLTVW